MTEVAPFSTTTTSVPPEPLATIAVTGTASTTSPAGTLPSLPYPALSYRASTAFRVASS